WPSVLLLGGGERGGEGSRCHGLDEFVLELVEARELSVEVGASFRESLRGGVERGKGVVRDGAQTPGAPVAAILTGDVRGDGRRVQEPVAARMGAAAQAPCRGLPHVAARDIVEGGGPSLGREHHIARDGERAAGGDLLQEQTVDGPCAEPLRGTYLLRPDHAHAA